MSKQFRLGAAFAALGFAVAALLFGYLEFTNYKTMRPMMLCASVVLCPPCLLSALFLDIEPHSGDAIIAWSVIAVVNALLYTIIGNLVMRYLWKPAASLQAKPQR